MRQVAVAILVALAAAVGAAGAMPRIASAAPVTPRIDLKVLPLGESNTQSDFVDWQAALEREGVPFDPIIASSGNTPITASTLSGTLSDGTPVGYYQAIPTTRSTVRTWLQAPGISGTSTYTAQIAWPAARTLTVQLSPARIVADGRSQSTATVTVASSDGFPIVGESPAVTSTDPGRQISAVTDNRNGTYTATITSSTTTGSATVTTTDTALPPFTFTGSATLMQTGGPATTMTVQLSPSSIVANGTSKSTATATLKDAQGRADIGDRVGFTSSDAAEKIGAVTDTGNGTHTAPITSSTTAHRSRSPRPTARFPRASRPRRP